MMTGTIRVERTRANRLEKPRRMQLPHRATSPARSVDDPGRLSVGQKAAYRRRGFPTVIDLVRAEYRGGVFQMAVDESSEIGEGNLSLHNSALAARWIGREGETNYSARRSSDVNRPRRRPTAWLSEFVRRPSRRLRSRSLGAGTPPLDADCSDECAPSIRRMGASARSSVPAESTRGTPDVNRPILLGTRPGGAVTGDIGKRRAVGGASPVADQARTDQTSLDSVDRQCPVDPPPKVRVLDFHPAAEMLPTEVVLTPPWERIRQGADQVAVVAEKRHATRAFDRFQSAYRGQQRQPIQIAELVIVGFQDQRPVGRLKRESPIPVGEGRRLGFANEQIIRFNRCRPAGGDTGAWDSDWWIVEGSVMRHQRGADGIKRGGQLHVTQLRRRVERMNNARARKR